jgi:ribosome-associated toxin RatA of RatAB toxin-antitoxin module
LTDKECHIHFELSFEFSTKLLALMFGPVFQHATDTMVDSFRLEAHKRYG